MLVHDDERPESLWRELLEQDRVRRAVPFKHLALDERLVLRACRARELGDNLGLGLAERERLGLGKEVGQEDLVVETLAKRILRLDRGEEVGGDELRALMDELFGIVNREISIEIEEGGGKLTW